MFLFMNWRLDRRLQRFADRLSGHVIPRVGWPTSVLPPRDVKVTAREAARALTVQVERRRSWAVSRLDLDTREVVVSAKAHSDEARSRLRRIALEFIADRNAFDRLQGLATTPTPPAFDAHDAHTWSEMQLMADVTDADWYPPEPEDRSPASWASFYATAHQFNDRFTTPDAEATKPRPGPPPAGRSSAGPATPGPSGSAGE